MMRHPPSCIPQAPLIVVGTGHSGTRVPARIAQHAGFYMGGRLNPPRDSMPLSNFVKKFVASYFSHNDWVRTILREPDSVGPCCPECERMAIGFEKALWKHRDGIPKRRGEWGWKSPNSFYLLPYFHHHFPELRVIHIIRHGLDVAYMRNRRELNLYGRLFLEGGELDAPEPVQVMAIWSRMNLATARYASRHLAGRYLCVRLEDLTAEPRRVVGQIFEFLGQPPDDRFEAAVAEIIRPASIGRWTDNLGPEIGAVREMGETGLREFGYWSEPREEVPFLLARLAEKSRIQRDLEAELDAISAEAAALRGSRAVRAVAAGRRIQRRFEGAIRPLLR